MFSNYCYPQDAGIDRRAHELANEQFDANCRRTDMMFVYLLIVQWIFAIALALILSPWSYNGSERSIHPHVMIALTMGGALTLMALYAVFLAPTKSLTRYMIAVAQVLFSSLLIQITGGRIETHFHIFGSLAFLAFYRDWKVLVPATAIVAVDHFVRGTWFPASVFGSATASPWRWTEHAGWVLFEDIFLVIACVTGLREMWTNAVHTATLEQKNEELKQTTHQRESAYRTSRTVIENSLDAVVICDADGVVEAWNGRAEQTYGWTADEAIGANLTQLIIPPSMREAHLAGMRKYLESGSGSILNQHLEVIARRRDGTKFPIELTITPMVDGHTIKLCAFSRDITARVEAAETLRKDRDEANAASRAKSTFLAHMSHEIRTPLNGILGYTNVLISKNGSLPEPERQEYLQTIHRSGEHLLELINDVLDLSRIESGAVEIERLLCSPHEIMSHVTSMLRVRAQEKGLELDYFWEGPVPEFIVTDPHRLRQVLMNLVGNAIKFTEVGFVHIVASLHEREGVKRFAITVRDTGMGIAPDHLKKIFEPFVQADGSVTRQYGGTGLGLAICVRIAEMLGGSLSVESTPGEGSSFTIEIDPGKLEGVRMLDGVAADILKPHQDSTEPVTRLAPCRILVAEDGAANRRLLEIILGDAGAEVFTAENGHAAIELATSARDAGEPFDVVLMDMQMPVLDGYSATRRLRDDGFQLPIFALTAHAMKGDEDTCRQAGCSGYLTKPINAQKLLAALARVVGTRSDEPVKTPRATALCGASPQPTSAALKTAVATLDRPRLQRTPAVGPMQEVYDLFDAELPDRIGELTTALASEDFTTLARTAHWLKGAAGTAGCDWLTEPAAKLEANARAGDAARCERAFEHIAALLEQLSLPEEQSCNAPAATAVAEREPAATNPAATQPANDQPASDRPASNEVATTPGATATDARASQPSAKIMIVDDEPFSLSSISIMLKAAGYEEMVCVQNPTLALSTVINEQPDLVLLDLHMPQMDGFAVLEAIRHVPGNDHMPVVMLTASREKQDRARALELGATDFLSKPFDPAELFSRVRNALKIRQYENELKSYARSLESKVRMRTAQLERARRNAVFCLARAAEFRDDDTGRHVIRVGRYAAVIADALGWEPARVQMLEEAAQLHDVGKIGVPDALLLKPGKLSPDEFEMMQKHCGFGKSIFEHYTEDDLSTVRRHAEIGNKILSVEDAPVMDMASRIALTHHEKFDGSGYPLGLKGYDIPLEGRIVAIADVFDALSTKRSYKPAFPIDKCMEIMEEGRGKHFDSELLDLFMARREQVVAIQIAHAEVN